MTDASVTLDCFALVDHRWRCWECLVCIDNYNIKDIIWWINLWIFCVHYVWQGAQWNRNYEVKSINPIADAIHAHTYAHAAASKLYRYVLCLLGMYRLLDSIMINWDIFPNDLESLFTPLLLNQVHKWCIELEMNLLQICLYLKKKKKKRQKCCCK